MEVCEEIISYPFVEYTVNVSHVTSRNSTAFEWLFLEALIKADGTEFQNENLEDFFKKYFQIDNLEKLIKPILKKLYDLQAVSCEKLTDDILLSDLTLRDVKVLPLGKEMQEKGLLPGEHSDDKIDVVYDVSQKKLITDRNKFSEEAEGNYVSIEETAFPEKLVREYIESQRPRNEKTEITEESEKKLAGEMLSQNKTDGKESKKSKKKKNKNKQKLEWLKDNTEINSVVPAKTEMCFDNILRKVHLKDGLAWKIESNKVPELDEASLENFENTPPEILANCPMTAITKPDEEIQQIILFAERKGAKNDIAPSLNKFIDSRTRNAKTAVLLSEFFNKEALQKGSHKNKSDKNKKDKSFKALVLTDSQAFSVNSEDGLFIVNIPERILPPNCIFMDENSCINAEKFPVKAGDVSRELTFAYLPKNVKPNIKNFILSIAEKYAETEPAVLLLLNEENGLQNEFKSCFEKLVSGRSVKEKAEKIEALNKRSAELTGKKLVGDETVFNLLINEDKIKQSVTDFASAEKIMEEYTAIPAVKNQVLRDLLKIVFESLNPADSLEDIWHLLDFIKQKSPDSVGYLDKQRLIGKLYSPVAKNLAVKNVFDGKLKEEHCDFEKRCLTLLGICAKINNSTDKKTKDNLNSWKTNFENFRKNYGTVEELEKYNREIESKMNAVKNSTNGGKKK